MFNVYIKPTEYCNLACEHCYVPESSRKKSFRMLPEDVDYVLNQCLEVFPDTNNVSIIFHGGEPLLMGRAFYQYIYNNWGSFGFKFRIQSNLLLYDNLWNEIIEKLFDGAIGTSFDVTRQTEKGFDDFFKIWIKKYEEAKKSLSYVSIGVSVSKPFLEKPLDYWVNFLKKLSPDFLSFEYYLDVNKKSNLYIPYSLYLKFLIDFINTWIDSGEPLNVRDINGLFGVFYDFKKKQHILKPGFSSCRLTSFCGDKNIVINPNGDIGICPALTANKFILGNIFKEKLSDILNGNNRIRFISEHKKIDDQCYKCKYLFCCEGHCIALKHYGEEVDSISCIKFLDEAQEIMDKIMSKHTIVNVSGRNINVSN